MKLIYKSIYILNQNNIKQNHPMRPFVSGDLAKANCYALSWGAL